MEYATATDENRGIMTVKIRGDVFKGEIAPIGAEMRAKAIKERNKLIFDFSDAKIHISYSDAYSWIADHYDSINSLYKMVPTAYIVNSEEEDFFKFVETTFFNRGANVSIFENEHEAVQWLESQDHL